MKKYTEIISLFVGLTMLQVLLLNNINLFGYGTPFVYIYLLLRMNTETKPHEMMLWAFCLGLTIDIFSDTPGMNAATSVLLAFTRNSILKLYTTHDRLEDCKPGIRTLGFDTYLKYTFTCVLLHSTVLLTIELFSFVNIWMLILKILASAVITTVCIIAVEQFNK